MMGKISLNQANNCDRQTSPKQHSTTNRALSQNSLSLRLVSGNKDKQKNPDFWVNGLATVNEVLESGLPELQCYNNWEKLIDDVLDK